MHHMLLLRLLLALLNCMQLHIPKSLMLQLFHSLVLQHNA
jgi:hypothetical protein